MLCVLFDSGGSCTYMSSRALPQGCIPAELGIPTEAITLAGPVETNKFVMLNDIVLPEFDRNKKIEKQGAFIFDGDTNYDIILGRDFLERIGFKLDFERGIMGWMNREVEMKKDLLYEALEKFQGNNENENNHEFENKIVSSEEYLTYLDLYAEILDAKYNTVSPSEVGAAQVHLTPNQRESVKTLVVSRYPNLFSGKLRSYKGKRIHLELLPNAVPVHDAQSYSVARVHIDVFKKEMNCLVEIGVIRPCGTSDSWALPTFIIQKKDQTVRVVSDFRELNRVLQRRVYPLPQINEILQRRSGYSFFTKFDLSMMFYAFVLDDKSSDLCTIITPFGKFQYLRLPMGVKVAPDIAQEAIEATLGDLDCETFIDDVGCFSRDWNIRRSAGVSDGYIPYVVMYMRYLASNESYNGTYEGRMIPTYDRHVTDVQDYISNEYISTRGTRLSESLMEIFRIQKEAREADESSTVDNS